MKQILTIGLLLSLLTGVPAGQAQPKARKSAIAGKILFESYHAVQNPPVPPIERNIDPKLLKPMPVHIDLVPDSSRTPLPRLKPLQGQFRRTLQKRVLDDYRQLCSEMEQRKPTRTPQRWIWVGDQAALLGLDSVAADCVKRFMCYHPSPRLLAYVVDSMMPTCREYARPMVEYTSEYWLQPYWTTPDTTSRGLENLRILTRLNERYKSGNRLLSQGMLRLVSGDTTAAGTLFMEAIRTAQKHPKPFRLSLSGLLHTTASLLSDAARYDELLILFAENEAAVHCAKSNPAMAFLLYRAALKVDPSRANEYLTWGMEADKGAFTEQLHRLRDTVYTAFVDNPAVAARLDYLLNGPLPLEYPTEYVALAEQLLAKLPDIGTPCSDAVYDESFAPWRDALLGIAEQASRLENGALSPASAHLRFISAETRSRFASSAEAGLNDLQALFEQLSETTGEAEYSEWYIRTGTVLAEKRSRTEPKAALKMMTSRIWPVFEQVTGRQQLTPRQTRLSITTYRCMARLYQRAGKAGKAKAMRAKAEALTNATSPKTGDGME